VASHGQEMLDKLHLNRSFDAIITDIKMPILDGKTAVKRLRDEERLSNGPKQTVIFLSGDEGNKNELLDSNGEYAATEVFTKPFNQQALVDSLIRIRSLKMSPCGSPRFSPNTNSLVQRSPHYKPEFDKTPSKSIESLKTSNFSKPVLLIYNGKSRDKDIEDLLDDNLASYEALVFKNNDEQECFQRMIRHLKGVSTIIFILDSDPPAPMRNIISRIRIVEKTSGAIKKKVIYCCNKK